MSHGKRKLKSNVNSMSLFQKDAHIHTTSLRTTRGREGGAGAGRFCRLRGQKPGGCRERGARGNGVEPTSAGSSPHKSGKEQEKRVGWQLARAFLLCAVLFCFVPFLGLRET